MPLRERCRKQSVVTPLRDYQSLPSDDLSDLEDAAPPPRDELPTKAEEQQRHT
jgi:hypothetical protein